MVHTCVLCIIRFCSRTSVDFVLFCSNLHHTLPIKQWMFNRKIRAEGSVLQELRLFVIFTIRCLYHLLPSQKFKLMQKQKVSVHFEDVWPETITDETRVTSTSSALIDHIFVTPRKRSVSLEL